MIQYTFFNTGNGNSIAQKLWDRFVEIDYGRAVPEKGYTGYRTFLEDVTGAEYIKGSLLRDLTLYFKDETAYTCFLLKWS